MLRLFFAAVLAACVAMPAGAIRLVFGVDLTLSTWTDMDTVVRRHYGERIFTIVPGEGDALWVLPPGGEDLIFPYWGEVYPEVQDGDLIIQPVLEYSDSIDFFARFDQPLRADLSNIGLVRFVSGGFNTTDCYRDSYFPCSSAGGRITWLYAPEPATWAMMIAGFALAGGTLRRRHLTHSPAR
jgi:hypothetical protein